MTETYLVAAFHVKPNIKLFFLTTGTKYGVAMSSSAHGPMSNFFTVPKGFLGGFCRSNL